MVWTTHRVVKDILVAEAAAAGEGECRRKRETLAPLLTLYTHGSDERLDRLTIQTAGGSFDF